MEWVNNNLAEFLVFLGLALLVIEILVLGFSTFVLFFIGLASLITGSLMFMNILPESMTGALISIAVFTGGLAIVLWKPLKKFQNKVEITIPQSDLIGLSFVLDSDVSPTQQGSHAYSGISWKILCSEELSAGTEVEVIKTSVGAFTVAAKT